MTTTKQKRDMLIDLVCKNARIVNFDKQVFTPYELIEELGGNEAKLMKYRYIEKLNWDQIVPKVDYSESRGYQIIQEALVKLAERAGDEFGLIVYK